MISGKAKQLIRTWVPPGGIRIIQRGLDYLRPAPWEYMPAGWRTVDVRINGWNVNSIAEQQVARWPAYVESLSGAQPLGINHEGNIGEANLEAHNTLITYAYVLALAAHNKQRLSLLDFGSGVGHYYLLSQAVMPDVHIEYYCQDLPLLCRAGREISPQICFFEEHDACFGRSYDLVLASSSLWYEEDWQTTLKKLVASTGKYLYIARMIFVERANSFVVVQRPYASGYDTAYLCWVLNRYEFLEYLGKCGLILVREFLMGPTPHIHLAPEQGHLRGFLFRRESSNAQVAS